MASRSTGSSGSKLATGDGNVGPATETVRRLFALYRALGSVRRVKEEADRLGLQTKCTTTATRAEHGGKPISRGHLYQLLSNPIYAGQIAHKGQLHPGQHPPLIDAETWTAVRNRLAANAGAHRRKTEAAEPSLLAGLLFDTRGERLIPSHAVKQGRRYRYYVSAALITKSRTDRGQGWRLGAMEIENAVIQILLDALANPPKLLDHLGTSEMPGEQLGRMLARAGRLAAALNRSPGGRASTVRDLVERLIISEDTITIRVYRGALSAGDVLSATSGGQSDTVIELSTPVVWRRRGIGTKLVLPGLAQENHRSRCDPALVKAVARGRAWFEELATGRAQSLQELAKRDGISRRYVRRLVNLAFLSPQLVEVILQGRQPVALNATRLTEIDLPLDWTEQSRLLAS